MRAATLIARRTSAQVLGIRRLIGLGVIALLPGVIVFLSTATASPGNRLEVFTGVSIGPLFSIVVPVVALILAASALGDERRDQTLSFIVLRPVGRTQIAAAKIVGATAAAWIVCILGGIGMGVAMGIRHDDWGYILPTVVGVVIAAAAYAAVFTPLGYLTERATLAGLAFVFIWEGAVAGGVPAMASVSPWRIGFSAFVDLAPGEIVPVIPSFALGNVAPGTYGAIAKMVVLFALGTALTSWILRRRDLV
jgi:ABC-2 type transport system permease protein